MPHILIICNANQFRSPFVESYLRHQLSKRPDFSEWQVSSAGVWAEEGFPVVDWLLQVAQSFGLDDLPNHRTRLVSEAVMRPASLVLVMEAGQKEALGIEFPWAKPRIFLLSEMCERIPYNIPDPAFERVDPHELTRELADLVDRGLGRIVALAK